MAHSKIKIGWLWALRKLKGFYIFIYNFRVKGAVDLRGNELMTTMT